MYVFGVTDKERGSSPLSSTATTPATSTFTRIQTCSSDTSSFLKLPGELRNRIYEFVAKDLPWLTLSAGGQIVLPPFGSVCKRVRTELRGIFEHEVIWDTRLDIKALVVNFDFDPLFNWLDELDRRPKCSDKRHIVRSLIIFATYRPKPSSAHWLDGSSSQSSASLEEQRLPHLILQNLMATMKGWSWQLSMYLSDPDMMQRDFRRPHPMVEISPHQLTRSPVFHILPRCRRIKSGYHYRVGIIADDTWRHLDNATLTTSETTNLQNKSPLRSPDDSIPDFYAKLYDALVRNENMRKDVDLRLALVLRVVCQSDCSKAGRDVTAANADVSHLYRSPDTIIPSAVKWAVVILDRAVKELSRLEADRRVERQKRHELLTVMTAEAIAKDKKERHDKARRSEDGHLTADPSTLAVKQRASPSKPNADRAADPIEELTRMMAAWHL